MSLTLEAFPCLSSYIFFSLKFICTQTFGLSSFEDGRKEGGGKEGLHENKERIEGTLQRRKWMHKISVNPLLV